MMDRLAQLPVREKIGLALALALVVLYVADLAIAKPLVRRLREWDVAIEVEQERLNHSLKVVSYETSVESQHGGVKDLIGVSGTEQESIEIFKNEIDEMALRNGVRLRTMRHLTPDRTDYLLTFIVEISDFEAEVPALINFLHAVTRAQGLLRVRSAVISSQGTDSLVNGSLVITKVMTRPVAEAMP